MLPMHFSLLQAALVSCGYKAEVLHNTGREVIETGLKYVNNDICYPALLVIGQQIRIGLSYCCFQIESTLE